MSISDIKHSLRKYEFPACAKEALCRIEQILIGRISPSSKQLDVAMDIISEFMFCETDRRGGRRGAGLSPLQQLQLIDIICDYLSACTNETTKNTVFLSLFGGVEGQRRLKILSILASMAVSASSTPVLLAVGVWLQQTGCSSPQSLQLVENIIRDHFFLNTSNQSSLKSLANSAPQFVSNFITAVTELYKLDMQETKKLPPKNLLEIITAWVHGSPGLCMSALQAAPLPAGAIPMAAVAPLAGLLRWTTLAPLVCTDVEMVEVTVPMKRIKLENEKEAIVKTPPVKTMTESELYIKLHLGVLQSVRAGARPRCAAAVSAQHLAALAADLRHLCLSLAAASDTKQECLDRIGQAVQVALANGCVYGNISILLSALETLPENRLLHLVIQKHRQTI
ncbi:integrator complex subunit 15 [Amyelois transitella]|uniref:integrator complex subunit 15 n=1 Tax=Amyelois transitella TaxID=680683 RepID=UPI00299063D0|nr:integrator complex subunit 15 [Amyelois transitella]